MVVLARFCDEDNALISPRCLDTRQAKVTVDRRASSATTPRITAAAIAPRCHLLLSNAAIQ